MPVGDEKMADYGQVCQLVCRWAAYCLGGEWAEALLVEGDRLRRWVCLGPAPVGETVDAPPPAEALRGQGPTPVPPPPWAVSLGAGRGLAAPIRSEEGKTLGLVAVYRRGEEAFPPGANEVITAAANLAALAWENDQLQRQRDEVRARLEALASHPDILLVELDLQGRFLSLSDAFMSERSAKSTGLEGRSYSRFVHPNDLAKVRSAVAQKAGRVAYRWWDPQRGEWIWLEAIGVGFRTPKGERRILAVIREITSEKRELEALQVEAAEKLAILNSVPEVILRVDLGLSVVWSSQSSLKVLGYDPTDLAEMPLADILACERHNLRELALQAIEGHQVTMETEAITKSGSRIPVELTIRALVHDNRPVGLLVTLLDITIRKRHEALLEEQCHFMQSILDSTVDGVYLVDRQRRIIWANASFQKMTGYTLEELVGKHMSELLSPEHDRMAQEMRRKKLAGEAVWTRYEIELINKDGRRVPVEIHSTLLRRLDYSEVAVGVARDISDRIAVQKRLTFLANHDPLTGLFNRHRFLEELEREMERIKRYGGSAALIWLDLDGFKEVNDTYGHLIGDVVLRQVANIIKEHVRHTDMIGRLGGDEFGILLINAGEQEAIRVAQRINIALASLVVPGFEEVKISAAMGIALLGDEAVSVETALARADRAMYSAKLLGGATFQVWHPQLMPAASGPPPVHLDLSPVIRKFLPNCHLYCQPILDLRSGEVSGYELLLRPGGKEVSPLHFVQAAESTDIIEDIDIWVLKRALYILRWCEQKGLPIPRLHVNVSPKSLTDRLVEILCRELQKSPVTRGKLVLEITEKAILPDPGLTQRVGDRLKSLGCALALDDFGAEHSNLHRLLSFDFDIIKIDGSLVSCISGCRSRIGVVKAIVALARALAREVIAEQVEKEETLRLLKALGINEAQGHYLGRPVPVEEVWPGLCLVGDGGFEPPTFSV